MNASPPLAADPVAVHAFCETVHNAAAVALEGANRPGMMQLVRIHPADGSTMTTQFKIGEIDLMTRHAVLHADAGFNVYVEARTVEEGAAKRGNASTTRGVFAFVVDADNDKGKGGHTGVQPSLAVETSPGNAHHWLFLSRALTADQAKPLGEAIRHKTGADSATGVVTQPYRVAGTPNYPGKTKIARGRVATQTRILEHHGKAWSADELQAAFPAKPKPEPSQGTRPSGASGRTSNRVEDLVSDTGADRSERFHAAVDTAFKDGLTPDDLEALMRQHPEGCGGKYLEPYDRLAREIERSWDKVEAKAEEVRQAASKPAYEDGSSPVETARHAVAEGVQRFIEAATAYRLAADDEAEPPVHALPVSTGVGKTRVTARTIAEHIVSRQDTGRPAKPILYAVPTHRLGNEIEAQFAEHGVMARVFRGRSADDPARPGEFMCDDLEAVKIALSMGAPVGKSCCKTKLENGTEARCQFFGQCSYQAQMTAGPEVWIVAHQMLFQATTALGKVEMVVIDEGFWQTGIRIPKRGLTLDEIGAVVATSSSARDYLANDVEVYRAQFARALKRQGQPGGVRRADLIAEGMTVERCTDAISAEWQLKDKVAIWPGMPKADRRIAARAADKARHSQAFITLWNAARGLLYDEEVEVSGRLYIDTRDDDDGRVLVAKARSLKSVPKQWRKPTLILDATLPSLEILQAFYPEVEPAPAIEAAMPHVRVRQVIDSPTSGRKLKPDEDGSAGRNLRAIRREILRRFLAVGRTPVLVIAQKAISEWLRSSGLPAGISTEHFNNVAGLDQYRAVRGLIVVGRTLPSPLAVEALAGAITGKDIEKADPWYPKPVKGLRTRDGYPVGMECEAHPDPVADACRWQICEGELMQALGRARGVNRTAADPLDIDIIANVVLPMTVDVAEPWNPPGEEIEMQIEGVVLDSAADMAAAWPDVWATDQAARHWVHRRAEEVRHSVPDPYKNSLYIGIRNAVAFRYQRPGARQKWRTGAYDPAVVPDPMGWLESRLGPLAGFHIVETATQPAADEPDQPRAADYAPALVARFRLVAETPAADFRPEPVKAEVVRWDLKMPGPSSFYAHLVAALPPVEPGIAAERGEPRANRVSAQLAPKFTRPVPVPAYGVRP
ncbi:DNA-primase RepB domain-containing protein [Methylobacterium sp. Leaf85]|uniref:DNA-primase RepB domain-containing protein n=1 Tax=Methylobacterium sp. Leaf85 TaxID=1736241 RepID=UPI0006F799B0|nr:DNA-primase RepB domain-containing protein [Methylobacterium sp. Leaf85]KQO49938.1 hypothetical protein ASF08_22635 [Methylobacterium sp. Leaf85]